MPHPEKTFWSPLLIHILISPTYTYFDLHYSHIFWSPLLTHILVSPTYTYIGLPYLHIFWSPLLTHILVSPTCILRNEVQNFAQEDRKTSILHTRNRCFQSSDTFNKWWWSDSSLPCVSLIMSRKLDCHKQQFVNHKYVYNKSSDKMHGHNLYVSF